MKPTRKLTRRSFLGRVAGGATFAGAMGLFGPDAGAQPVGDCDFGPAGDPAGSPSGLSPRREVTDRDSGPDADPGGRGCGVRSRLTDADSGANADRAGGPGRGTRKPTGITDTDEGRHGDPARFGRGPRLNQ